MKDTLLDLQEKRIYFSNRKILIYGYNMKINIRYDSSGFIKAVLLKVLLVRPCIVFLMCTKIAQYYAK